MERRRPVVRERRQEGGIAPVRPASVHRRVGLPEVRKVRSHRVPKDGPQSLAVHCREIDKDTAIVRFPKGPAGKDRRRFFRKRITLKVELTDDRVHWAHTRDVGIGGLFVVTNRLRTVGSRVTLRLWLAHGLVKVVAKVRWIRALSLDGEPGTQERGLGLQILALSRKGKSALGDILRL